MQYEIEAIDPDSINTYPKGRTFEVCPLTPLVRKRLFNFFKVLLNDIPDEAMKAFKKKEYDILHIVTLVTEIVEYLEQQGKLENLVAIIIRDAGVSDRDKNIDEIADYLELNCKPVQEVAMFANFFEITSMPELFDILQSMKSNLTKSLTDTKPES